MIKFNKAILFLLLLQFQLLSYGQSHKTLDVKITGTGLQKATHSVRVNDIPTNITNPPLLSYLTPQVYAINSPINPLAPANTGGDVPQTNYGEQITYAGPNYKNIVFENITGITVEPDGNIYAANWAQNQILKVTTDGTVTVIAGSLTGTDGSANGPVSSATFYHPDALLRDAAGNILVSDQENYMIRKITPGGIVSTFAGTGLSGNGDNAVATLANFNTPRGMTRDAAGNIYVVDQGNNAIRKISTDGAVTTVAGSAGPGFTNGNTTTAKFDTPTAVGIDGAGNLYVSDSGNGAIRKIATDGTVSTIVTGLDYPRELRLDGTGNIYVVEQNAGRLSRISPAGEVNVVFMGLGSPIGLVLDGKGSLYIGANNFIHKVIISGYTIDKALPTGLSFDSKTGIISGTPTVLWPATNYKISGFNGGGSNSTTVSIAVAATAKKPSVITLPTQQPDPIDANNNYDPKGTSTNTETPIKYISSNPAVATITADGLVHLVGPGLSDITATQLGNENYSDAFPAIQHLTVTEHLYVDLPPFESKTLCSADFDANAFIGDKIAPVSYTSSNPNVATISTQGIIHITRTGTTVITVSQNTSQQYYLSAQPKSQTLTVVSPVIPDVSIAAVYASPCSGSVITFTATGHNAGSNPVYQWQVNNVNVPNNNAAVFKSAALKTGDIVTCSLINNDNPCLGGFPALSNSIPISVIIPVIPSVNITSSVNYVFPGTNIIFNADVKNGDGTPAYQWSVNGIAAGDNSPRFESNELADGDLVKCVIAAANSCSVPVESPALRIYIINKVEIPNTFTPNADGINDTWFIKGLAGYPNCLVSIYNRYGKLLMQSKGYSKNWDGTINGSYVPAATYYYVIDLKFQDKVMSGFVAVIK